MTNQDQSNRIEPKTRSWDLSGAVLAALAASLCCAGPLVMAALGLGAAWAGRLALLEPYRPIFVALSLGFLGFALYRTFRQPSAESCAQPRACNDGAPHRANHTAIWSISAAVVMLLGMPYLVTHLRAGHLSCGGTSGEPATAGSDACCAIADQPEARAHNAQSKPAAPIDPSQGLVFEVENLQCPAVKGVGCGSMLWPVLTQIDQVNGVSESFSNWTGTRLRVSVSAASNRKDVAERVRRLLASDGRSPVELDKMDSAQALQSERWHSATGLIELSSFEFRTIAKRRVGAFADARKLDAATGKTLLDLVDQLWDKSGEGLASPAPQPDGYRRYWRARIARFAQAYAKQARSVLSDEQLESFLRQYGQTPDTLPAEAAGDRP